MARDLCTPVDFVKAIVTLMTFFVRKAEVKAELEAGLDFKDSPLGKFLEKTLPVVKAFNWEATWDLGDGPVTACWKQRTAFDAWVFHLLDFLEQTERLTSDGEKLPAYKCEWIVSMVNMTDQQLVAECAAFEKAFVEWPQDETQRNAISEEVRALSQTRFAPPPSVSW